MPITNAYALGGISAAGEAGLALYILIASAAFAWIYSGVMLVKITGSKASLLAAPFVPFLPIMLLAAGFFAFGKLATFFTTDSHLPEYIGFIMSYVFNIGICLLLILIVEKNKLKEFIRHVLLPLEFLPLAAGLVFVIGIWIAN